MDLSKIIFVQEMTSFIQSGMTYDKVSTVVKFWFCKIYTLACQLRLYISLFQGRQMTKGILLYLNSADL